MDIETEALKIWQEREMRFDPRLRRMHPGGIDMATGAWRDCLSQAMEKVRQSAAAIEGCQIASPVA